MKNVEANQNLKITYDKSKTSTYNFKTSKTNSKYFQNIETEIKAHDEDFYVDFDHEGLIFKMQSREGPTLAFADINDNGNPEIFMGGARGQSAQIFNLKGKDLSAQNQKLFDDMAKYEDTASTFIDIDNDGDMDLIIGSGGNFKDENQNLYNIRILKNDGSGNFEITQILNNPFNTSTLKAYDFDQDGDKDLFVGNFSVPGIYGVNPKSKLFENDGKGNFTDITEQKAYDFKQLGMVKDAVWYDINDD